MSVTAEIATDLLTPLGAYLRLREGARAAFLLDSVERGRLGRHSFVGRGSRIVDLAEAESLGRPVVGYVGYDVVAGFEPTVPLPEDGEPTAGPGRAACGRRERRFPGCRPPLRRTAPRRSASSARRDRLPPSDPPPAAPVPPTPAAWHDGWASSLMPTVAAPTRATTDQATAARAPPSGGRP